MLQFTFRMCQRILLPYFYRWGHARARTRVWTRNTWRSEDAHNGMKRNAVSQIFTVHSMQFIKNNFDNLRAIFVFFLPVVLTASLLFVDFIFFTHFSFLMDSMSNRYEKKYVCDGVRATVCVCVWVEQMCECVESIYGECMHVAYLILSFCKQKAAYETAFIKRKTSNEQRRVVRIFTLWRLNQNETLDGVTGVT